MTVDALVGGLRSPGVATAPSSGRTPETGSVPFANGPRADVSPRAVTEVARPGNADTEAAKQENVVERTQTDTHRRIEKAPRDLGDTGRYRYNLKFVNGMVRPLVQLVDTKTDRLVSSYPPEQMARLLQSADHLGERDANPERPAKFDASA